MSEYRLNPDEYTPYIPRVVDDATRLSNAKGLYLEGIRDGKAREAVLKYTGGAYKQHSTGVPDGQDGFIRFFEEFLSRNPKREIEVVRGWVDGRYVFLHVYQSLNDGAARWVTTDFFDTDDEGRMIEHWDVIAEFVPKTPSGRTNIDGATEITDLDQTDANKATVRRAVETLLMRGGDPSGAADFIAEDYIQHNKEVADGLAPFAAALQSPERKLWYERIVLLVGRGNFVSTLCETSWDGQRFAQVDVFRLEEGRIVEHWDCVEPCPPASALTNSGKF
jgi:predicted SnoaL-like aldol condensation-catalyzing enzyme